MVYEVKRMGTKIILKNQSFYGNFIIINYRFPVNEIALLYQADDWTVEWAIIVSRVFF